DVRGDGHAEEPQPRGDRGAHQVFRRQGDGERVVEDRLRAGGRGGGQQARQGEGAGHQGHHGGGVREDGGGGGPRAAGGPGGGRAPVGGPADRSGGGD